MKPEWKTLKKEKRIPVIWFILGILVWLAVVLPLAGTRDTLHIGPEDVTPHWDERSIFYFPEIVLDKGVYLVEIDYVSGRDLEAKVASVAGDAGNVRSTPVVLPAGEGKSIFRIMPDADNTRCTLHITEAEDSESFMPAEFPQINIFYSRSLSAGCYSIYVWLAFLGIGTVYIVLERCRKSGDGEAGTVIFVLLTMILLVWFSLIADGTPMSNGGDQEFHLERIANLAEALKHNVFQLRMQPLWHNGYGYPVAIFYGELFMVPSALLYAAGLPLYQSYNVYLALTGTAVILCSYFSFKMMTESRWFALLGSILHVAATGFDVNRDISGFLPSAYRGIAGTALAIAFLPVVAAGFHSVRRSNFRTGSLCLVIGFTGLLHTHTITVTRALMFAVLYVLAEWKIFFQRQRFLVLLKSALITVVINMWFVVPFLDYYLRYDLAGELFHLPKMISVYKIATGISTAEIMFLMLGVYCLIVMPHEKEERKRGIVLLSLYGIALFIQTDLFPHKWLYNGLPVVFNVFAGGIQFLHRYGVIASLLVILFGLHEITVLKKHDAYNGKFVTATVIIGVIAFIAMINGIRTGMLSPTADYLRTLDLEADDFGSGGDNLYLFDDIDFDPFEQSGRRDTAVYADGVSYDNLTRDYTRWTMTVSNAEDTEGYLEFPVFHYHGYYAEGNGVRFPVTDGINHRIRVGLPPGYEGDLTIDFSEPWYWRLSELASVLGGCLAIIMFYRNKGKDNIQ